MIFDYRMALIGLFMGMIQSILSTSIENPLLRIACVLLIISFLFLDNEGCMMSI